MTIIGNGLRNYVLGEELSSNIKFKESKCAIEEFSALLTTVFGIAQLFISSVTLLRFDLSHFYYMKT